MAEPTKIAKNPNMVTELSFLIRSTEPLTLVLSNQAVIGIIMNMIPKVLAKKIDISIIDFNFNSKEVPQKKRLFKLRILSF